MKKEKEIFKYSDPVKVQKLADKYFGIHIPVYLSTRPEKKYMIYHPITGRRIHFGQMGYEDFTKHKNPARRENYLTRASNIKGNWKKDKFSPNNLSIHILW
jgi:hypothetical protein